MSPKTSRSTRLIPVAALCALLLVGCGEEEKAKVGEAKPDLKAAETAVLGYYQQILDGDVAACERESEAFAATANEQSGVDTCEDRISSLSELMVGIGLKDALAEAKISGRAGDKADEAIVTVSLPEALEMGSGGEIRLVLRDGDWLIDAEFDDSGSEAGEDGSVEAEPSEEAKAWAAAWCGVEIGAQRQQVVEAMGEPTDEGVDEDGQVELTWSDGPTSFVGWFDDDVLVNTSAATPEDSDLPC